jgi:hypothetical protein
VLKMQIVLYFMKKLILNSGENTLKGLSYSTSASVYTFVPPSHAITTPNQLDGASSSLKIGN